MELKDQPPANLVFLLDVSGSMSDPMKLPLLKRGFRMLVHQLRPQDRVAIVTYAGRESVVLPSTPGDQKEAILRALDDLEAGGSTNGAGGIQKAYEIAVENFMEHGNNRVLLATDGDFNVGLSQTSELSAFIAQKRDTGVFLSVYGFGSAWDGGNYKDEVGEQLAQHGNGFYFYIDSQEEARRAFLETVSGSLLAVAKDVKVQVEFNPAHVKGYRLIGYENRILNNQDFHDERVDAGELGAGLSVTALFEIIPAHSKESIPAALPSSVPELPDAGAQATPEDFGALGSSDVVDVRVRYKQGRDGASQLLRQAYGDNVRRRHPSLKFVFAAGVSEFAAFLRGSQYTPAGRLRAIVERMQQAEVIDPEGAVREMRELVEHTGSLTR